MCMKSVLEYKDYHLFMQDYYDERKRLGAFSWREFCKSAGFTSPNFLKLVCMGQSKLSKIKARAVAQAMKLVDYEEDYFCELVTFCNAEKDSVKKEALLEMQKIALEHKAEEVHDILSFLVKAGFLKKDGEKVYSQTEQTVIGSKEALPIAIRSMHREMANMAVRAVDRYSPNERFFTGVTLSVNQEASNRIVEEINACCKKVLSIANEYKDLDQVCRINFQFFPVTEKIKEVRHA